MFHWLPENISTYGSHIDHVMRIIYYIVGAWFVLVEGILLFFVIKFRRKAGQKASFFPGNTWSSLAWILIPALVILGFDFGIDYVQGPVWKEIKEEIPTADQHIRINGRQFVWEMTQPGADGKLDTADDIQTLNQLTVQVGKKIEFELSAADVIHSLWVPNLRLKQDAVPGRKIHGWFEATKEGTYEIGCAQLCGMGHGNMRGELHVMNEADYQKWLKENAPQEVGVGSP